MEEITWQDPPPPRQPGPRPWRYPFLEAVKARPGKWAMLPDIDGQKPRTSAGAWFRNQGCEVVTRSVGHSRADVYVRWPLEDEA